VNGDTRSSLLSTPGIVGHHMPPSPRSFGQTLPPGSTLVLHSDGLTERWNPAALPGLFSRSAAVVAGQLLREAGVRRDDASVLAARGAW
jgi:serine phosphatase RsbU (regulator of sigma subunit)